MPPRLLRRVWDGNRTAWRGGSPSRRSPSVPHLAREALREVHPGLQLDLVGPGNPRPPGHWFGMAARVRGNSSPFPGKWLSAWSPSGSRKPFGPAARGRLYTRTTPAPVVRSRENTRSDSSGRSGPRKWTRTRSATRQGTSLWSTCSANRLKVLTQGPPPKRPVFSSGG